MADSENRLFFSNIWCFRAVFFAQNSSNVFVQSFFACFWQLYLLTKTDHFAEAMHRLQPFQNGQFSNSSHFSNVWCFYERFLAHNNFNMVLQSFFPCCWQFCFLNQTDYFAKALAYA